MTWKGERSRHVLSSKGIKSSAQNQIRRMASLEHDMEKEYPRDQWNFAKKFGFNPMQTVAHGTSLERAQQIYETGLLLDGTYVNAHTRNGFVDASIWAANSRQHPVVVMAEVKEDISGNRGFWGMAWITLGKRAEEREGIDRTYPFLTVKKLMVFDVPEDAATGSSDAEHVILVERPELTKVFD